MDNAYEYAIDMSIHGILTSTRRYLKGALALITIPPVLRMYRLTFIVLTMPGLNACAVNGIGWGFTVTQTTTDMGTIEHVKGYGVLLDTRNPTRSISVGEIERFLLCPAVVKEDEWTTPLEIISSQTHHESKSFFNPSSCHTASAVMRERSGLSLDFSPSNLRLTIGYQRQTIMRINQDANSVFHVQFNSEDVANGQAILFIPKEPNE